MTFFPFEIDFCPRDQGYWIDGLELIPIVEKANEGKYRLKISDRTPIEKKKKELLEKQIREIENRVRIIPDKKMNLISVVSFWDLPLTQKLIALTGLPIESDRLYHWRSWVNLSLIGSNIIIFGVMIYGNYVESWIANFGFIPSQVASSPSTSWYTLLTCMFLHGGIFHLIGNMFFYLRLVMM